MSPCRSTPAPADAAAESRQRRPDDGARAERLPSDALLRGPRLVEITHNGEVYRLQATRLGKLILTK